MTAEIAIINKSALALAADSAVTIAAGSKQEKIYDSADKLFELSHDVPIGVMLYSGMSFMEIPFPLLVKDFRSSDRSFDKVQDAAKEFLEYLCALGRNAPDRVKDGEIKDIVSPTIKAIRNRFFSKIQEKIVQREITREQLSSDEVSDFVESLLDDQLALFERIYRSRLDAKFVGDPPTKITGKKYGLLKEIVDDTLPFANSKQRRRAIQIAKRAVVKEQIFDRVTGIVVAGFGKSDMFPTLVSYEVEGMVFGSLKYQEVNFVDIDRDGDKARVIPFAQKEMVERFLYGLDEDIENDITMFCRNAIPEFRQSILENIEFDEEEDLQFFEESLIAAEAAFLEGLEESAFDQIRSRSQAEIEDMVEFMPKPEMAKMAEALVNLTSIKRRVSRGMETVGGPIDVAVLSRAEGFVWVKRKHYFPPELNVRYFERLSAQLRNHWGSSDEQH